MADDPNYSVGPQSGATDYADGTTRTRRDFNIEQDNTVSSLADLGDLVFAYRKDPKLRYWIFRGGIETPAKGMDHTAKRRLNLTPKIGHDLKRSITDANARPPYTEVEEESLYEHFRRTARPYLSSIPDNYLDWISIARHHELPTRLLDWTESLLVAAYFAVSRARTGDATVIYATPAISEPNMDVDSIQNYQSLADLNEVVLYRPPHISPRITAQRGLFTVHRIPTTSFDLSNVVTIRLGGENPITYKMDLHHAGINQATLFPDIDGIASQLHWQYKWGHLPPHKRN